MYQYYNAHPKGLIVGDCVKRAFTLATGKTYQEVTKELNDLKRCLGAKKFSNNNVWKEYVKINCWKKLSFPAIKGESRMNGYSFCKRFPKGKYILNMAHHLTCCVDGIIYDTWNCLDKCVYTAYKI
jgi:hypothetical protein